jgi:mannosyltransferase OCH1-like enzyme
VPTLIPHIFHQIWVGPDPFLDGFGEWRESWKAHHPGWEFRLWTDENLPGDFRNPEAYEHGRRPVERADIIRLEVLWKYGGVYVDADMECRKPIDALIEGLDFFGLCIKPGRLTNTVIGAAPRHAILDRALDEVRPQDPDAPFDKTKSGPVFLDNVVKDFQPVTMFPRETFYPITPEEEEDAFAVHHCARTWKSLDDWKEEALRGERRLLRASQELEQERRAHLKTKQALEELRRKHVLLKDRLKRDGNAVGSQTAPG